MVFTFLMFGKGEIQKIKAWQDKGVFLNMFECVRMRVPSNCLSVRQSVCKLFAVVQACRCSSCVYVCASTSKSHIWL